MPPLKPANLISARLDSIILPPLSRPPVGPNESPTIELIDWTVHFYVYSAIAHFRTILRGLIVLATTGNKQAMFLVERHLYEWTMNAVYLERNLKILLAAGNLTAIRELFDQAEHANGWIRNHGSKYALEIPTDGIPDTLRVSKLVKAYEEHQTDRGKNPTVRDDYGYLSEHSHANGTCFLPYRVLQGNQVSFVEASLTYELTGIAHASAMDWLLAIYKLLSASKESKVLPRIVDILKQIATESQTQKSSPPGA